MPLRRYYLGPRNLHVNVIFRECESIYYPSGLHYYRYRGMDKYLIRNASQNQKVKKTLYVITFLNLNNKTLI
jgi:hypothetical protein